MGFSEARIEEFRKLVAEAKRPVIFFDDDVDGVTSFTMLYHAIGEGKGVPVKKTPEVNEQFIRKVEENQPDVVFILDKPKASEEFLSRVKTPIVWLDHHEPQSIRHSHVHYFNPRLEDDEDNRPTSYWVYTMVGKKQDLWLAAVGSIGDWHVPEFLDELPPDLLPARHETIGDLYLSERIGTLILALLFNLKGTVTETMASVKTLSRIEGPNEILGQTTPKGKFLWKKYEKLARAYKHMVADAEEAGCKEHGQYLIYVYKNEEQTFTAELSNELLLKHPDRIVIIARHNRGEMKASLRSAPPLPGVDKPLAKALEGVRGYGGGHRHACGACIREDDWERFLSQLKEELAPLLPVQRARAGK